MLYLISLGIFDEKDMSIRAIECAKKCDFLFFERYTSKPKTDAKKLSKFLGKEVLEVGREELEENSENIIRLSEKNNVGIIVSGDALVATTHISLIIEARKRGIDTKVIHGSSIYTAVCSSGLQIYKFGRTVTLTKRGEESIIKEIKENKKRGLHTLVLLDVDLRLEDAIKILLNSKAIKENENIVFYSNIGEDEIIKYITPKEFFESDFFKNLEEIQFSIIIPGKLHFIEEEALYLFK
jgi:diphthine synthase